MNRKGHSARSPPERAVYNNHTHHARELTTLHSERNYR